MHLVAVLSLTFLWYKTISFFIMKKCFVFFLVIFRPFMHSSLPLLPISLFPSFLSSFSLCPGFQGNSKGKKRQWKSPASLQCRVYNIRTLGFSKENKLNEGNMICVKKYAEAISFMLRILSTIKSFLLISLWISKKCKKKNRLCISKNVIKGNYL